MSRFLNRRKWGPLSLVVLLIMSLLPLTAVAADRGEWQPDTAYVQGDTVTYNGQTYECLQSHTSLVGWEPSNVPSLWEAAQDGDDGTTDDTEAPSVPGNVTVTDRTASSLTLGWTASTDNVGVTGYNVGNGSGTVASVTGTGAMIDGLDADTSYTFSVTAEDAAGNVSSAATVNATTAAEAGPGEYPDWDASVAYTGDERVVYNGDIYEAQWWTQGDRPDQSDVWEYIEPAVDDTTPPGVPTGLTVTDTTSYSVTLSWDTAADNVGVAEYEVYNGSSLEGTSSSTNFTVHGLSSETSYTFTVKARDEAGNTSEASVSVTAETEAGSTEPPPGERRYVAYASTWDTSFYDLEPQNVPNYITNLNLAFVRPNTAYEKGSYTFDQEVSGFEFVEGASTPNGQKTFSDQESQDLINTISALQQRGTDVFISVGGWAYSQGSQWQEFSAPHVVDLALDLGASGVDIDWESSGSSCNKSTADQFSCTGDAEIVGIITSLYDEIQSRGADLEISIAGWSTGAYYVEGTPFEEGKVQWGSPFGGTMYTVVKEHGDKIDFVNLMSYDAGDYYDPREGYESYRAIFDGPINMGMEIAPEGSGGAVLELEAPPGTVYDAEMLTGENNTATQYYNVETMVNYMKNEGQPFDGFMLWQLWKQRVHQPAPEGAATENSAGQYVCENLPLNGDCGQTIPDLPKRTP